MDNEYKFLNNLVLACETEFKRYMNTPRARITQEIKNDYKRYKEIFDKDTDLVERNKSLITRFLQADLLHASDIKKALKKRGLAECEELRTELKFKVEYIQEQREVIKDLEKKLKIAIEALKDIYDKADEIYFDKYRTSLFCEQVRSISIQALEELE